jgi:glycosyltransferase involved in cell wall biosynthesis
MRIAQVAPLTEAIPPKLYGGTERVVSWLTEELVALGHDVTLFASGDSRTKARLEPIWPRALRLDGKVRDPDGAAHGDAGARLSARRPVRHSALPPRLLSVLAVFTQRDAVHYNTAWQA